MFFLLFIVHLFGGQCLQLSEIFTCLCNTHLPFKKLLIFCFVLFVFGKKNGNNHSTKKIDGHKELIHMQISVFPSNEMWIHTRKNQVNDVTLKPNSDLFAEETAPRFLMESSSFKMRKKEAFFFFFSSSSFCLLFCVTLRPLFLLTPPNLRSFSLFICLTLYPSNYIVIVWPSQFLSFEWK